MLFEETKTVWWTRLLWAIAVGDVVLGVWLWQKSEADALAGNPLAWIGIGAVLVTLIALVAGAVMFSRYSVSFDGERLGFGFTKVNGYVPIASIESVEVIPHVNLLKFGGLGWRFNFGEKKIGFLANKGSAMEITPKGGNWRYVFNCDDPGTLAALLEKHGVAVLVEDEE